MDTRKGARVPYQELHMPSSCDENDAEDPKDEDFGRALESSGRRQRSSGGLKYRDPLDDDYSDTDDDRDTYRLALSSRAPSFAMADRVIASDDNGRVSPTGKPCPFYTLDEIRDTLLNPSEYFQNSCGVNVLVPEWDVAASNKLQFFDVESQVPRFEAHQVATMTDAEIDAEIADLDKEIVKYDNLSDSIDMPVLVTPYTGMGLLTSIVHDVRTYDWEAMGRHMKFDVILMDPPWRIQVGKTTRGVQLGYDQLHVDEIGCIPIHHVQDNGFVFMWVVASTIHAGVQMLAEWGYDIVYTINWMKISKKGVYQPSIGYYLQHDKETCLVGRKGSGCEYFKPECMRDTIVTWRNLRQSHKPEELYEVIENAFPACSYLEIFARSHNLRDGWVSLGLEVP